MQPGEVVVGVIMVVVVVELFGKVIVGVVVVVLGEDIEGELSLLLLL